VGTFIAVACHPFRECGAGDAGFRGDVCDGAAVVDDAGDEALSSFRGQRGVSDGSSERVSFCWMVA
jgi:hypothetical protein